MGNCTIKRRSSTKKAIVMSSAEAELYAATRAISEAIGLKSLGRGFRESVRIVRWADAQATIGLRKLDTSRRPRCGSKMERGESELRKLAGEDNPADVLKKPVAQETLDRHLRDLGCHVVQAADCLERAPAECVCVCVDIECRSPCDIPTACERKAVSREQWRHTNVR